MNKFFSLLIFSLASFFVIVPAHAQIPTTDVANIQQQTMQYMQMGLQYTRQGLQLQNELKNLMSNPSSLLGAEVGGVVNGVGQIMSAGNSIGSNMARISSNFEKNFKNPQMRPMSEQFTKWHNTSTDTLQGALMAAGLHREAFKTDTDALTAMYNKSQASGGNLQALQSLAEINAMQVQQMQKLQDLIATQNIAANTYMAAQEAKEKAKQEASTVRFKATELPAQNTYKNPTF